MSMIRIVTLVLAAALATGCAGDARGEPGGGDREKVSRAGRRGTGGQRGRAATPMPDQFRGPESDEEMLAPPSPTSAPNEDDAAARCRLGNNWNQPRLKALT